jgi:hypothetical protein
MILLRVVLLALSRSLAAEGIALAKPDAAQGKPDALSLLQLLDTKRSAVSAGHAWSGGSAPPAANQLGSLAHMMKDGDECDLCGGAQDWLFILGTGRSGSTTALEMFNAIPGVYLAGENSGVMNTLMDLYESSMAVMEEQAGGKNRALCALQRFVKTLIGQFDEQTTKVIGFKEIRHLNRKQLSFFKKVFPGAKIILNTRRNLHTQHQSQFQMDIPIEELSNWTKELELFQVDHPQDTFSLHLEEYNAKTYNRVLDFLQVQSCYYAFVAHANHGWHWNDDMAHAQRALKGSCVIDPWKKEGCTDTAEPMSLSQDLNQDAPGTLSLSQHVGSLGPAA